MSAEKTKPGIADFIYIPVCIAIALAALWFFWKDLNQSLAKANEVPVGTISYKYKAAQRRFSDRVIWDRLRQASPVYNGDFIRTAELSEATVTFNSGDEVGLQENSLVRIVVDADSAGIDLAQGGASASARNGTVKIQSGAGVAVASAGSSFAASAGEDGSFGVQVLEGTASIQADGKTVSASAGDSFTAGDDGTGARVTVAYPWPAAKIVMPANAEGSAVVRFVFNRTGFASGQALHLDVAEDKSFARIAATLEGDADSGDVPLPGSGAWYWRAYPVSADGSQGAVSTGRFRIIPSQPPRLLAPAEGGTVSFRQTKPQVHFQWTSSESAQGYLVEAGSDPSLANPAYRTQVQSSGGSTASVTAGGLSAGRWYWRVTPLYPRDFSGEAAPSDTASFRIEQSAALAAPAIRASPAEAYLEGGDAYFSWKAGDDAASYTFVLSRSEDLSSPVFEKTVKDNYIALDAKAAGLAEGAYYWGVYETAEDGGSSGLSRAMPLAVLPGSPGDAAKPQPPAAAQAPAKAQTPSAQRSQSQTQIEETEAAAEMPLAEEPAAEEAVEAAAETAAAEPAKEEPPAPQPAPAAAAPLTAPRLDGPADGYQFTNAQIASDKKITFSWRSVPGATRYQFLLYRLEGGAEKEIIREDMKTSSRYELSTPAQLGLLDHGDYVWKVAAIGPQGESVSERRFSIDTSIESAQGKAGERMYSNQ